MLWCSIQIYFSRWQPCAHNGWHYVTMGINQTPYNAPVVYTTFQLNQTCRSQNSTFKIRVFSQHFGNMTQPLELGIFASFYTKLGKNTPYKKNKNIKYFVYSTSYSSLTHKQILKSDLQSDLPFVVGAQKNPLIKMVLLSTHNICFAWEI